MGYKTKYICQGNRVIIEVRICQNLEVQISVGSKGIKPSDFGIWDNMPNISSNSITVHHWSVTAMCELPKIIQVSKIKDNTRYQCYPQ